MVIDRLAARGPHLFVAIALAAIVIIGADIGLLWRAAEDSLRRHIESTAIGWAADLRQALPELDTIVENARTVPELEMPDVGPTGRVFRYHVFGASGEFLFGSDRLVAGSRLPDIAENMAWDDAADSLSIMGDVDIYETEGGDPTGPDQFGVAYVMLPTAIGSGAILAVYVDLSDYLAAHNNSFIRLIVQHAVFILLAALLVGAFLWRNARERTHSEQRLRELSLQDSLTGLGNRRLFQDRLVHAVALAKRNAQMVGVHVLDLDHFKQVNDSLGHEVGDELLKAAAERLRKLLRDSDTLARLGGDEFAIVQPQVDHIEDVVTLAERIIEGFRAPFSITGRQISSGTSIGVAISPANGTTTEDLLRNADTALYEGKAGGRGSYRLFSPDMATKIMRRQNIERGLVGALRGGDLVLHYQPRIEIETGRVTGVEALTRWRHPYYDLVSPTEFISVVEDSPILNFSFGNWSIRHACEQAKTWGEAGMPPVRIAVNLSSKLIAQPEILTLFDECLAAYDLDPEWLEIEVTETAVIEGDYKAVIHNLAALNDRGVVAAIDDFGTGYASLGYLRDLPAARVKIDRSYVASVGNNEHDTAIVRAVVELARNLGITAVAEGVETPQQLAFLRKTGCHEAQGYYFSRPLPAEAMTAWFAARESAPPVLVPALTSVSAG